MSNLGRKEVFRWAGWFACANAIVLALIGLRYFQVFTPGDTVLSWVYLLTVYPAHHILISIVPLFVVLTPIILIRPSKSLVTTIAVLLFAVMIALIMLDSLLWAQSRFHLNGLTLQILGWQSWLFVAVIFVIALFFEWMLTQWVWLWVERKRKRSGFLVAILSLMAITGSQLIHAWADATYDVSVTSVGQQLPVYGGFTAKRQLVQLGLVDLEANREREMARRMSRQLDSKANSSLNYPLKPLQCDKQEPMNVLLIMSDALRSDMVDAENMPFLTRYSQTSGQRFNQHFSGGNSSRMGVFSLFYGLPPGYWASFESLQRSSVLIDELQKQHYQFGLFSSSPIYRPIALDRTAFANVLNLRMQTEPADAESWQRDEIVRNEWSGWLQKSDSGKPFFGFLFFDATNAQTYPSELLSEPALQPHGDDELSLEFADYRRSARFIDQQLEMVLEELERSGLAEKTVVVITADHGEEFNESGVGLMGHGSGFTRYQVQVPMIVHWPGLSAAQYDHRTSHYDIVPTLMKDLLGCTNEPADYSSGRSLFSGESWNWLLVGSYYNYAVLEPDQITVTYPNGQYEVRDWNYRIMKSPQVRGEILSLVTSENSRFYR